MADRTYLESYPRNVQDALYDGQKILAVKLVREARGWDLPRATEELMLLESQLREQCPGGFAHPDLKPAPAGGSRLYLPDIPADVQDALYDGRKIRAIKLLRTATGRDLKAAKEAVESIHTQLRRDCPEGFASSSGNSGCTVTTSLFAAVLIAAIALLRQLG